eukprot:4740984-Pyramimonas_sp.AAC.2
MAVVTMMMMAVVMGRRKRRRTRKSDTCRDEGANAVTCDTLAVWGWTTTSSIMAMMRPPCRGRGRRRHV